MTDPKHLFDVIREIKGAALTGADVARVNAAIAPVATPPVGLHPSQRCATFIKGFEQCRLAAYLPTPDDVPTIGWGTTKGVRLGLVWTQAQADAAFAADLAYFGAKVAALLNGSPTTQGQYDAMVSLAYNIGATAFGNSTLLRMHKAGDFTGAALQFPRWNKQAGKVLNGLTRRRADEAAMYRGEAA
jgi:lysozyme